MSTSYKRSTTSSVAHSLHELQNQAPTGSARRSSTTLNSFVVNTEVVQIRSQPASERVPAMPLRQRRVAFKFMICFRMVASSFSAVASIEHGQYLPIDKVASTDCLPPIHRSKHWPRRGVSATGSMSVEHSPQSASTGSGAFDFLSLAHQRCLPPLILQPKPRPRCNWAMKIRGQSAIGHNHGPFSLP